MRAPASSVAPSTRASARIERASPSPGKPLARTTNWLARSALGKRRVSHRGVPPFTRGRSQILKQPQWFRAEIVLGVTNARAGADCLHVAGRRAADVCEAVAVSDRALAHVRHDLHVSVAVGTEAGARSDLVVIPDDQCAKGPVRRVAIARHCEVVPRLEPAKSPPSSVGEERTWSMRASIEMAGRESRLSP